MQILVDAIADLSSQRDREALDFALVTLVMRCVVPNANAVHLVGRVGETGDQRWQTRARLTPEQEQPSRDRIWVDFNTLPPISDFPNRQICIQSQAIQRTVGTPCLVQFPVGATNAVDGVLEVQTESPLDTAAESLITGLLKIYSNVQGLLDYGEKDSLTELLNRKTFDGAFIAASQLNAQGHEWDQPERRDVHSGTYWLAVLDIDHFKQVNDQFGHLIGDEVLVLLARLMRNSFRYNDQLYRFGGEEFVVLMRCAHAQDAGAALERFRMQVLTREFPQVGQITVSIGFAPLMPDDTPGAAFGRADKAVYYAKGNGRNQVCNYVDLVAAGKLPEESETETDQVDFF